MPRPTTVFVCVTALTLTSCITHNPTRTFDRVNHVRPALGCPVTPQPEITSVTELQRPGHVGDEHRRLVACSSEERHAADATSKYPHDGFNLHVLEFDDDGVPWNADQQTRSLSALSQELGDGPAVVLVFVHGWKNDASVCNGNIACFREMLEVVAKAERSFVGPAGTPRRVVGVYIGWRGGTVRAPLVKQGTFWGRKHTAHVIGDNGGVTSVIERLRAIVKGQNTTRSAKPVLGAFEDTSMVFVGHSFGGALLFSALATSLNADVGKAIQDARLVTADAATAAQRVRPAFSSRPVCVASNEDLVVLVNPAMEASRFTNLAETKNLTFEEGQLPIFMTLASEGDSAVGAFFPIGQALGTLSRSARSRDFWLRMDKGFGMYEPFLTHRVVVAPGDPLPDPPPASGTCACKRNLRSVADRIIEELQPLYEAVRELGSGRVSEQQAFAQLRLAGYQELLASRLEPTRDVDPNNPFVMASVDPAVVGDHGDIFNARFTDFLLEYILRSEIKRNLVRVTNRGCRQ